MLCAGGSISMSPRLSHGQRFDRTPLSRRPLGGLRPDPISKKKKKNPTEKTFFFPAFSNKDCE
jgi:hypothetical protein